MKRKLLLLLTVFTINIYGDDFADAIALFNGQSNSNPLQTLSAGIWQNEYFNIIGTNKKYLCLRTAISYTDDNGQPNYLSASLYQEIMMDIISKPKAEHTFVFIEIERPEDSNRKKVLIKSFDKENPVYLALAADNTIFAEEINQIFPPASAYFWYQETDENYFVLESDIGRGWLVYDSISAQLTIANDNPTVFYHGEIPGEVFIDTLSQFVSWPTMKEMKKLDKKK